MRKPLVVVCVAASALLLTGGIAATSASAEDTPDVPGLPGFSMPDFLTWPNFTDDTGDADDSTSDDADQDISGTDDDNAPDAEAPAAAPVRERPAAVHRPHAAAPARDKPDAPTFAQRNNGSTLIAAARRDVTAADVSSSPNAPVQQQILALVNLNRRRGGCGDLSIDRRLIDAANEHAADMARRDYFAHESPNGDRPGDRVSDAGYRWKRYGENLAMGVDSAYEVVDGWMHSPEHRENIMDCRLDQMGVGLAIARDHTPYWVQDFATPMT